jgi:hypothetical protein
MSVRDDVQSPPSVRVPRAARATLLIIAGALVGATLAGSVAARWRSDRQPRYEAEVLWQGAPPSRAEWPRPALPGESATRFVRGGHVWLEVHSFTSAGTAAIARDLERRRLSGVDGSAARRSALRAAWRAAALAGGPAATSPRARCAALVRARLLLVALADPHARPMAPARTPAGAGARVRLERAEAEVVRLALAVRPEALASALTACAVAESDWLRVVAGEQVADPLARLESAWRWHERQRAPQLEWTERVLEGALDPVERAAVQTDAIRQALMLERLAPEPAAVLFGHGGWAPPEVTPIARARGVWPGIGALAGALAGLAVHLVLSGRRRRRSASLRERFARAFPGAWGTAPAAAPIRLGRESRCAWEAEMGWLHVVSGPDPGRIAHAVSILASSFLERDHRVLLMDAGRQLRLHDRYGADTRWGLGECMAGEVPLLGAVQGGGRAGFFLLAHGASARAERWEDLSRLLEEARAHFGRVILALDARAPRAAALPLGGRVLEAWWAEPGPDLPRGAIALSERLGIPFTGLDLNWLMNVTLEAMEPPAAETTEPEAQAGEATAGLDGVNADPGPGAPPEPGGGIMDDGTWGAAEPVAAEPLVLAGDPAVRERLRFLLWMRRVREERRAVAVGMGTAR